MENEISGEIKEENGDYEEIENKGDSVNFNKFKFEKSKSHYVKKNYKNNRLENLNQNINKIKTLDDNNKRRNKYVMITFAYFLKS